jgi:hypothetical protein
MAQQENINVKVSLDTSQFDTSLKGMKQEFRALERQLGSSILSDEEKQKVLLRMGELKHSIEDLNMEIKSIDDGNVFGDIATLMTPLAGAFTAAGSALSVFGIENEKVNEILQKTSQLTIGLMSIQQLADTHKLKSMFLYRKEQLKNYLIDKLSYKQTKQQIVATTAETTAKGASTIATKLATRAQLAWNAAIAANPIGLLLTVVAALTAALFLFSKSQKKANEEREKAIELAKKQVEFEKQLTDFVKNQTDIIKDLETEYNVLRGTISEFDKQILDLEEERDKKIKEVTEAYEEQNKVIIENKRISVDSMIDQLELQKQILEAQLEETQSIITDENGIEIIIDIDEEQVEKDLEKVEQDLIKYRKIYENQQKIISNTARNYEQKITQIRLLESEKRFKAEIDAFNKIKSEYDKSFSDISKLLKDYSDSYKSFFDYPGETNALLTQEKINDNFDEYKLKSIEITKNTNERIQALTEEAISLIENRDIINQQYIETNRISKSLEEQKNKVNSIANPWINILETIQKQTEELQEQKSQIEIAWESQKANLEDRLDLERGSLKTSDKIIEAQKKLEKQGKLTFNEQQLFSELYNQQLKIKQDIVDSEVAFQNAVNQSLQWEENRLYVNEQFENSQIEIGNQQKRYGGILSNNTEEVYKILTAMGLLSDEIDYVNILQGEQNKKIRELLKQAKESEEKLLIYLKQRLKLEKQIEETRKKAQLADLQAERERRQTESGKDDLKAAKKFEEERLQVQREAIDEYYKIRIEQAEKIGDETGVGILTEQWTAELDTLETNFKERWKSINANVVSSIGEISEILFSAVGEVLTRDITNKYEQLNNELEKTTERQIESLDNLRNADLISEEEYNTKLEAIEEERTRKENELKLKQAKAEKNLALFQILMDTAVGVAKSWGQGGGLFGAPLSAIVAAQGALQAALVASQPLPEYETGGFVSGPSHTQGGVPIEAEGGEFIVRREIAQGPGMAQLLNGINQSPSSTPYDDNFITKIIQETIKGVSSIPVVNVETDYTKVQRKVKSVETRARF